MTPELSDTASFTDNLPSGLRVAAVPNVTIAAGTCTNPAAALAGVTAAPGATSITLTNVQVTGGTVCAVDVDVTNAPGQLNASCASNPTAFTNTAANISGVVNMQNAVSPSCVVVTPLPLNTVKTLTGINGAAPGPGATLKTGDIVDYTITASKSGVSPVSALLVREVVPPNMVFSSSGSTPGWSCPNASAAGTVCDQPNVSVPGNGSTSVVFRTIVTGPTGATPSITNTVQVSQGSCSSCSVTTPVTNLNTVKQLQGINGVAAGAGAAVKPGDILDYVMTVTNPGGAAGSTLLQETVPAGTTFSAAAPSTGWSCADGSPAGTACNKAVTAGPGGGIGTANFRVVVNASTNGLTQISNTVSVNIGTCSACTVNDPLLPTLRLVKTSIGGVGSFAFTLAGVSTGSESLVTTVAGTPVASTVLHVGGVGMAASVNEAAAFGFRSATSCTDGNGGASGNGVGAVTTANATANLGAAQMRAGAAWVCTYTNTRLTANLSVVKTANPTNVRTGGTVVFTLTVNNAGPDPANGAILRDKPDAGLSCTAAPTCTASGGASCPSAAALTAPALTSNAGVLIPVLPAGGQLTVTLSCIATATGQ